MSDRWQMYRSEPMRVAAGWAVDVVAGPSRLAGSNGITIGPDGRLFVTQVFGSQVTAIDVRSGAQELFSPLGRGINGPDDAVFGADGTFYAAETVIGRVSALQPDGSYRVVCEDLPGANGITMDHRKQRLFVDEFRLGGRLMELDPAGRAAPRILLEDLNGPNALAMGPDGRLYFPQVFANEIWAYDLESGQSELVAAGLSVPTAVKFDSRGWIVTSEAGAGRVTAIDPVSGTRETLTEVELGIDNIAIGTGDRIFVSHYTDGRVAEETGGTHRVLSEPGLVGPFGLALGRHGDLVVADGLSVTRVGTSGGTTRVLTLNVDLFTLAVGGCDLGGDLAVLGLTGEILRYANGSDGPTVVVEGLEGPTALVPDGDGLLVVERGAARVSRVGPDGQRRQVANGLKAPAAVARDGGRIVITQGDGGPVVLLEPDGQRREIPGFADAQGAAVSSGTALVADVGRRQLVALDLQSGRIDVVASEAPIGLPAEGFVLAAFCPICPDGNDGFYVGCNGDGSIRRVRPAR